jgi:hypothetical protein
MEAAEAEDGELDSYDKLAAELATAPNLKEFSIE